MIQRLSKNLGVYDGNAPPETRQLEVDGTRWSARLHLGRRAGATRWRSTRSRVVSPGAGPTGRVRYEMFNRSALAQAALAQRGSSPSRAAARQ